MAHRSSLFLCTLSHIWNPRHTGPATQVRLRCRKCFHGVCHVSLQKGGLQSPYLKLLTATIGLSFHEDVYPAHPLLSIGPYSFRKGIDVGPISRCSPVTIPVRSLGFPNLSRSGRSRHSMWLFLALFCVVVFSCFRPANVDIRRSAGFWPA